MTKYGSPKPIADHELSVATAIATASENILMLPPYHAGFSVSIARSYGKSSMLTNNSADAV